MQNDSHPKTFDGGVEGHAVNSCHIDHVVRHAHEHDQGRSALSSPPKYKAAGIKPGPSDQLTKTPSADHDDGNLRGLSAPNHQPHAVSQGWRDDRVAVARALYEVGRKAIEPTLGMRLCDFEQLEGRDLKLHLDYADAAIKTLRNPPLPAPPSPAKTGGADEIARALANSLGMDLDEEERMAARGHSPSQNYLNEWNKYANAILAFLSRAGVQSNSTQKDGSR